MNLTSIVARRRQQRFVVNDSSAHLTFFQQVYSQNCYLNRLLVNLRPTLHDGEWTRPQPPQFSRTHAFLFAPRHAYRLIWIVIAPNLTFRCPKGEQQFDCALDLMRRLPPQEIEKNLGDLIDLVPSLCEDLLSSVDQPLKIAKDKESGRDYLLCDYNRDGDSYRLVGGGLRLVVFSKLALGRRGRTRTIRPLKMAPCRRSDSESWSWMPITLLISTGRCISKGACLPFIFGI